MNFINIDKLDLTFANSKLYPDKNINNYRKLYQNNQKHSEILLYKIFCNSNI